MGAGPCAAAEVLYDPEPRDLAFSFGPSALLDSKAGLFRFGGLLIAKDIRFSQTSMISVYYKALLVD